MTDFILVERALLPVEVRAAVQAAGPKAVISDVDLVAFLKAMENCETVENSGRGLNGKPHWSVHIKTLVEIYRQISGTEIRNKQAERTVTALGFEMIRRNDGMIVLWNQAQMNILHGVITEAK